jgi:hypothetical protein
MSDAGANGRSADDLGYLLRAEAHRWAMEAAAAPDPVRLAAGWERRFIAAGSRVDETLDLYRELGYEVVADPVLPSDLAGECSDCAVVAALSFRMIYTRRPPAP